jgi:hypothetical protein
MRLLRSAYLLGMYYSSILFIPFLHTMCHKWMTCALWRNTKYMVFLVVLVGGTPIGKAGIYLNCLPLFSPIDTNILALCCPMVCY